MNNWLLALTSSYLLGSIPTAYLLVRYVKRIDVRTVGSGNVGATNASRVLGMGGGIAVFLLDALKGLAAVLAIAPWAWGEPTGAQRLACGVAAVVGHNFPVFLGFRGGKGVATTIGVMIGTMPHIAALAGVVWAVGFALTRYVSLSSLVAILLMPLGQWFQHRPVSELWCGLFLTALILARHHGNIRRLLAGQERRITFGSSRKAG